MFTHAKVDFEFDGSAETTTSYFVCSTPRCGSSLICEALLNSKLAGAPTEYFDADVQAQFYRHWNIDSFDDYLALLFKTKTSPNGVFGTKAHFNQFNRCFGVDKIPSRFPNLRFIWVRRNNILEQAVSYALAIQTEKWSIEQPGNGAQPVYQFDQIAGLVTRIQNEQSNWARFFEHHSIEPLALIYESFSNNLIGGISDCLKYLEIDVPNGFSIEPCTLQKQADRLSQQWIERFQSET